jgi:hypothetical protein
MEFIRKNLAMLVCLSMFSYATPLPQDQTPVSPAAAANSTSTEQPAPPKQKLAVPGQITLQDGTPIRLRLSRNVSSADAHEGESVDFEVLEDVPVNGILVIPKTSVAIGTVTEAQPKRRMGRAGKLEIVLDYVRLANKDKAAVRAVKNAKGGSHTVGMTAGIVATGLLFFPAAPFFLFMHGKDITVPKGAEVTAYINGDVQLAEASFAKPDTNLSAAGTKITGTGSTTSVAEMLESLVVTSTPEGAEVYLDGSLVGNAPATLKLNSGKHTVGVKMAGYKDWSRDVLANDGTEARLTAALETVN